MVLTNNDRLGLGAQVTHYVTVDATAQTLEQLVVAASRTYVKGFRHVILTNLSGSQEIFMPNNATYPAVPGSLTTGNCVYIPTDGGQFSVECSNTFFDLPTTLGESLNATAGVMFATSANEATMAVQLQY